MSLEPVPMQSPQRELNALVPVFTPAGFRERRELGREARRRVFNEELNTLITSMRMCNTYKLHQQMMELHIRMGEEFASALASSDNPLIRQLLEAQFESWKSTANSIISGRML